MTMDRIEAAARAYWNDGWRAGEAPSWEGLAPDVRTKITRSMAAAVAAADRASMANAEGVVRELVTIAVRIDADADLPFGAADTMQQAAATIQAQAKRLMALEALAQRVIDWHVRVNTPSPTGIDCAYLNGEDGDGWDDMEAIEKEARALLQPDTGERTA